MSGEQIVSVLRNSRIGQWATPLLIRARARLLDVCKRAARAAIRMRVLAENGKWRSAALYSKLAYRLLETSVRLSFQIVRVLRWLFVPESMITLLYRHSLALIFLWIVQRIWHKLLHGVIHRLGESFSALFGNASYNRQRLTLIEAMENAKSYTEWGSAASDLDRLEGKFAWKEDWRSQYYDYRRIKQDLLIFRRMVDTQDVAGIMRHSRSRLLRNLAGIGDKRLYTGLRAGTKRLIEEYISEVVRALQIVCVLDTPHISNGQKLAFFNETRHAFGRSALLLSGGATLGLYHTGICKALNEQNLLPRVISGSSVGSVICAIIGTRTDDELKHVFDAGEIKLSFFPTNFGSVRRKFTRFFTQGVLMDIRILETCVRANVRPWTFAEAYDRTGRIINIVVSPTGDNKDAPRLLNYLTAPNVMVWSACLASCAIPLVYAPVELMAKDEKGNIVPYLNDEVKWEDGSIQSDLPMQRLSELFNINHFIVSQVNPHVIPFLDPEQLRSGVAGPIDSLIHFLRTELKNFTLNITQLFETNGAPSNLHYVLDQKYVGDITLAPQPHARDYFVLLQNPTTQRLEECVNLSQRTAWSQMALIRGHCEIEFTLDDCVRRMRGALLMEEASAHKRMATMSKVKSWSADVFGTFQHRQARHSAAALARARQRQRATGTGAGTNTLPDSNEASDNELPARTRETGEDGTDPEAEGEDGEGGDGDGGADGDEDEEDEATGDEKSNPANTTTDGDGVSIRRLEEKGRPLSRRATDSRDKSSLPPLARRPRHSALRPASQLLPPSTISGANSASAVASTPVTPTDHVRLSLPETGTATPSDIDAERRRSSGTLPLALPVRTRMVHSASSAARLNRNLSANALNAPQPLMPTSMPTTPPPPSDKPADDLLLAGTSPTTGAAAVPIGAGVATGATLAALPPVGPVGPVSAIMVSPLGRSPEPASDAGAVDAGMSGDAASEGPLVGLGGAMCGTQELVFIPPFRSTQPRRMSNAQLSLIENVPPPAQHQPASQPPAAAGSASADTAGMKRTSSLAQLLSGLLGSRASASAPANPPAPNADAAAASASESVPARGLTQTRTSAQSSAALAAYLARDEDADESGEDDESTPAHRSSVAGAAATSAIGGADWYAPATPSHAAATSAAATNPPPAASIGVEKGKLSRPGSRETLTLSATRSRISPSPSLARMSPSPSASSLAATAGSGVPSPSPPAARAGNPLTSPTGNRRATAPSNGNLRVLLREMSGGSDEPTIAADDAAAAAGGPDSGSLISTSSDDPAAAVSADAASGQPAASRRNRNANKNGSGNGNGSGARNRMRRRTANAADGLSDIRTARTGGSSGGISGLISGSSSPPSRGATSGAVSGSGTPSQPNSGTHRTSAALHGIGVPRTLSHANLVDLSTLNPTTTTASPAAAAGPPLGGSTSTAATAPTGSAAAPVVVLGRRGSTRDLLSHT